MPVVVRPAATDALNLTQFIGVTLQADEKHPAWARWIHSSINKHFTDRLTILPLYLEGDERIQQENAEFCELRIDGPAILQTQKDFYFLDVQINVLIQCHMDINDLYKIQKSQGHVLKAFSNAICVYKFGDGQFDNEELLGVLRLRPDIDEIVDVNNFGIVKEGTRLVQVSVEGHYRMEISNGSN